MTEQPKGFLLCFILQLIVRPSQANKLSAAIILWKSFDLSTQTTMVSS